MSIFTSCKSQPFRSAYILSVALVQAANAEANNSDGDNPKSFPPFEAGSSASKTLPEGERIFVRYASFLMLEVIFATGLLFKSWIGDKF